MATCSSAPVPDLSIEVDDIAAAEARFAAVGIPFAYGPADEPWGVRRFFVHDPFGRLVNILVHRAWRHLPSPLWRRAGGEGGIDVDHSRQ